MGNSLDPTSVSPRLSRSAFFWSYGAVLVPILIALFQFVFKPIWVHDATGLEIPVGTNVLLLDATSNSDGKQFFQKLRKETKGLTIDFTAEWSDRYPMTKTRIYFMRPAFARVAYDLEDHWVGEQEVIDYENQAAKPIVERPSPEKTGNMQGFDSKRDLVIFVGDDWKIIAANL